MAMSWLFKGSFWLLGTFSAIQMPLSFEIDLQMPLSSSLKKITVIYKTSIMPFKVAFALDAFKFNYTQNEKLK